MEIKDQISAKKGQEGTSKRNNEDKGIKIK